MVATAELLMHKDCWHATVLEENGLRSVIVKLHELKIELHYAPIGYHVIYYPEPSMNNIIYQRSDLHPAIHFRLPPINPN